MHTIKTEFKPLKVVGMSKAFGEKVILQDTDFSVEPGEVAILTGPSGIGKTTLIRCLSGLEKWDAGEMVGEKPNIGMVFQSFNLFPHLNARENIMLPLTKVKKVPEEEAKRLADEILEELEMSAEAELYEFQLSGGQRQRVAIARAVAMNPDYLCFDEPTSALDSKLRDSVGEMIRKLSEDNKMGIIIISHDREFSEKFSDSLYVLEDYKLKKIKG
ncbi:MAG: ATP-binding cassette domain-containing protein [Clostridiaceae bacterium]